MTAARTPQLRGDTDAGPEGSVILLAHGGGGQLTDQLLSASILPVLGNAVLDQLLDAAVLPGTGADRLALTIDGYVVQPWRFPGGDIGRLAVCGTVNDLAMCGARPLGIALGLIVAEGFARSDLDAVLASIAASSAEAGVPVVSGDTKVVGRGGADGLYISTAGVGRVPADRSLGPHQVRPGDLLLLNGPIGEHGLAVMLAREMPEVQSVVSSDVAPLNGLVERVLERVGPAVRFMRDPTRAGLAGVAADLAAQSGWHVTLDEATIEVRPAARHAAEMLGLDPLEIANEGKVLVVVDAPAADAALAAMRAHRLGAGARIIGEIEDRADGRCELRTAIGGRRIVPKPYGEQLPRIC